MDDAQVRAGLGQVLQDAVQRPAIGAVGVGEDGDAGPGVVPQRLRARRVLLVVQLKLLGTGTNGPPTARKRPSLYAPPARKPGATACVNC